MASRPPPAALVDCQAMSVLGIRQSEHLLQLLGHKWSFLIGQSSQAEHVVCGMHHVGLEGAHHLENLKRIRQVHQNLLLDCERLHAGVR